MQHLGSISGTGELSAADETLGPARYEIDVYEDASRKLAVGRIEADDQLLLQTLHADATTLQLSDGTNLAIKIRSHSPGTGEASFLVNDAVPGF